MPGGMPNSCRSVSVVHASSWVALKGPWRRAAPGSVAVMAMAGVAIPRPDREAQGSEA